ncbi:MAG: RagB/SusD family nutrient uptake outer membrane protein [Balneola sp.]|nr:MAG: RagB/SusD family nutrient uptake outer membrane protein [Balneola sp.]
MQITKNRTKIFLVATLLIGAGCGDVLEPQVYGDLTPETFFGSEADFNNAVIALYSPFMTDWGVVDQGDGQWYASLYNADPKTYLMRSMITTDEMFSPWVPDFTGFTFGPATLSSFQASTYAKIRYVARATDVIDKIQNSSADVPTNIRDLYVAEAKVLRAWTMYIIYDFFGPVNVKLNPETLSDIEITPRLAKEDYLAAMITDLEEAIPNLTDKYNGDTENWGRVSQGLARMVLLKIYMHEKNWAEAEQIAQEIVAMNYELLDSYPDVFNNEQNNELIYAVPADASSPNYYTQEIIPTNFESSGSFIRSSGWYGLWMPWDFYDTFDAGDERLDTILDSYIDFRNNTVDRSNGMNGAIPLKYTELDGNGPGHSNDQIVYRFAEVLLSLAEAINEQRGPADAYQYINQVRNRVSLSDLSGLSQTEFRDAILVERGHELFAEGVRRQDLIRHGKFIEYAQARGTSAQSHHVLFPIPQEVILQGEGIIEQNPGYN